LIGSKVKLQVDESSVKVYCGREEVITLSRRYGKGGSFIDFRHVIASLVRKPGAIANWRHRESLFPGLVFRKAYDQLIENHGLYRGERDYLHLLKLAADTSQSEVEEALEKVDDAHLSLDTVRRAMPSRYSIPTNMAPPMVLLSQYDELFEGFCTKKEVTYAN